MDGQILAGDESHKITKSIRVTDAKAFQGVYTMVNEFNQVVLQVVFFSFLLFVLAPSIRAYISRSVYFEKRAIVCFSRHHRFATYSTFLPSALLRCVHVPYQFPASQAECLRWSSGRNKAGSGRACPTISAAWIQPHQGTSPGWNRDVSACGTGDAQPCCNAYPSYECFSLMK